MAREITKGQIDRYVARALSLHGATKYFEWAVPKTPFLGRRAVLKALRGYMGQTRNQMRRAGRRRKVGKAPELALPYGGRP